MRRSYRVEIQPTKQQVILLLRHAGCARWAYNWGLAKCMDAHKQWVELGRPKKWGGWLSAFDLQKMLTPLKALPSEGRYSHSKPSLDEQARQKNEKASA